MDNPETSWLGLSDIERNFLLGGVEQIVHLLSDDLQEADLDGNTVVEMIKDLMESSDYDTRVRIL